MSPRPSFLPTSQMPPLSPRVLASWRSMEFNQSCHLCLLPPFSPLRSSPHRPGHCIPPGLYLSVLHLWVMTLRCAPVVTPSRHPVGARCVLWLEGWILHLVQKAEAAGSWYMPLAAPLRSQPLGLGRDPLFIGAAGHLVNHTLRAWGFFSGTSMWLTLASCWQILPPGHHY